MLKALELIGFKSFADRTRFEFPRGITVVVGPNGSGKSNIVDAIKWVLGEQSVKSLRGKEMVDVIFNGCATRRPLNTAECTLTFDNSERRLPIDSPEVHITRRVYRSGEGEYLINRQACRLRDIRELFAGTGVATEAYSVIEQGKVDVMLQSSAKDRRAIFEEASGISRFKAKKIEAIRRLDRVDQNLLRLGDIVEEVESRLKSVRAQASKARRYKEYADRLQVLRTQVGLTDWRKLGAKLKEVEQQTNLIRQEIAEEAAAADESDEACAELESHIAAHDESIRSNEWSLGSNRERIATIETTIDHLRGQALDLEEQSNRHRRQLHALSSRAIDLAGLWQSTQQDVDAAEAKHQEISGRLADEHRALTALTAQLDHIRQENEQRRVTHLEQLRASATLTNEISTLEGKLARTEESCERHQARLADLQEAHNRAQHEADLLAQRLQEYVGRLEQRTAEMDSAKRDLAEARRQLVQREKELARVRERVSGANERAALLEELERRHEGIDAGVQEVLRFARENPDGPFKQIRGLLADLIQVNVEAAPLIEAALGERAEHLVVAPGRRLMEYLIAHGKRINGRVGFLPLDAVRGVNESIDLTNEPGVVGRADRFVQSPLDVAPLVRRLLGTTWIVENLNHALRLAESTGRSQRFVTLAAEVLDDDGTLYAGVRRSASGLISRRSELRSLQTQIAELDRQVASLATVVTALEQQVALCERGAADASEAHRSATEALAQHRLSVHAAEQRRDQLAEQQSTLQHEHRTALAQCESASRSLTASRERLGKLQSDLAQAEARMSENARRIEQLDTARQQRNREAMNAQVELARSEQRLDHLRSQLRRYEQDRQERARTIAEAAEQLSDCQARLRQIELHLLQCESDCAALYLHKESLAAEGLRLTEEREQLRDNRSLHSQIAQRHRAKVRKLEEKVHARELATNEIHHERAALESRLREDYGIELAELTHEPTPEEERQREQVEAEITDLRRRLSNIGGVNLDALEEVDELEARYQSLYQQHQDLSQAKDSLEQIIQRINADSRRLFTETLEIVKGHFQQLFRKLFGGGQADIILEEGVDILESGIEIVARPPGKEPRNISLLSGGEKTLTCVALLLAIFRSRPSPFCVLDEVDAALDEANIERFVNVLKEFLEWTQFIVVTHSKKTMAFASSLYGVTMQESGISKRVSVRFDDVSDDGEISRAALERAENQSKDAADASSTEAA